MMRKLIVTTIATLLAMSVIFYVGAKSTQSRNDNLIKLQENLIEEQTGIYNVLSEEYRAIDLGCVKRLNDVGAKMKEAHELAEAYRATIDALTRNPLDFSLAENQ